MKYVLVILGLILISCSSQVKELPEPKKPKPILIENKDSEQELNYIKWRNFDSSTLFRARAKNLPIAVFLHEPTCSVCAKMEQETFKDAEVIYYLNNKFIPSKLNINDDPETALVLLNRDPSVPGLAFLAPNGNLMTSTTGFYPKNLVLKIFNLVLDSFKESSTVYNLNDFTK